MSEVKHLLIVAHNPSPNTQKLVDATLRGAMHEDIEAVEVKHIPPLQAVPDDVLWADAIILDLEDSVIGGNKYRARQDLPTSIARCQQADAIVFVRINSNKTEAFKDADAALMAGATGLYVPKASVKRLGQLHKFLARREKEMQLNQLSFVALIEDAKAVLQAQKIANQKRVIALTLGAEDYANNIGAVADPDVLRLPKQMVHLAAKSNGLLSFGLFGSIADYADAAKIKAAALEAKRFGFDGASCVHPSVIKILNNAFRASKRDFDWANSVLQKAKISGAGAFEFEGKMVDAPILERAETIVQQFNNVAE